jgi:hypothetical protein
LVEIEPLAMPSVMLQKRNSADTGELMDGGANRFKAVLMYCPTSVIVALGVLRGRR